VNNIEPPCWWTGMRNDTLQLMISGPGIGNAAVSTDYPGVSLLQDLTLDNPDYKFLYLRISPDTNPGDIPISFRLGKQSQTISYPLLQRSRKAEDHKGFDAGDVLYLLMP
ncbi:MAG: cyclomaltodextrinase N-terminal domain-containing protein, partial [Muribaculaceae bacterium]|nr:cyclomaltodextrinase N-terminal domain-containing protein [Muribaculaceae bacterium]